MPSKLAYSAALCTKSLRAFFSNTCEASLTNFAESEYLHPLLEIKASEGFESRDGIKSYDARVFRGLLREKKTVVADSAAAACNSKHQALRYREEGWDFDTAGPRERQEICKNFLGTNQKHFRVH